MNKTSRVLPNAQTDEGGKKKKRKENDKAGTEVDVDAVWKRARIVIKLVYSPLPRDCFSNPNCIRRGVEEVAPFQDRS